MASKILVFKSKMDTRDLHRGVGIILENLKKISAALEKYGSSGKSRSNPMLRNESAESVKNVK